MVDPPRRLKKKDKYPLTGAVTTEASHDGIPRLSADHLRFENVSPLCCVSLLGSFPSTACVAKVRVLLVNCPAEEQKHGRNISDPAVIRPRQVGRKCTQLRVSCPNIGGHFLATRCYPGKARDSWNMILDGFVVGIRPPLDGPSNNCKMTVVHAWMAFRS